MHKGFARLLQSNRLYFFFCFGSTGAWCSAQSTCGAHILPFHTKLVVDFFQVLECNFFLPFAFLSKQMQNDSCHEPANHQGFLFFRYWIWMLCQGKSRCHHCFSFVKLLVALEFVTISFHQEPCIAMALLRLGACQLAWKHCSSDKRKGCTFGFAIHGHNCLHKVFPYGDSASKLWAWAASIGQYK